MTLWRWSQHTRMLVFVCVTRTRVYYSSPRRSAVATLMVLSRRRMREGNLRSNGSTWPLVGTSGQFTSASADGLFYSLLFLFNVIVTVFIDLQFRRLSIGFQRRTHFKIELRWTRVLLLRMLLGTYLAECCYFCCCYCCCCFCCSCCC